MKRGRKAMKASVKRRAICLRLRPDICETIRIMGMARGMSQARFVDSAIDFAAASPEFEKTLTTKGE